MAQAQVKQYFRATRPGKLNARVPACEPLVGPGLGRPFKYQTGPCADLLTFPPSLVWLLCSSALLLFPPPIEEQAYSQGINGWRSIAATGEKTSNFSNLPCLQVGDLLAILNLEFVCCHYEAFADQWIGNVEENSHYKSKLITRSSFLNVTSSYLVSFLGSSPAQFSRALARKLLGHSWSTTVVDAVCSNLMQYDTVQNVLFMAMTEFAKFSEEPDWTFMREKQNQLALLFGIDDHWAPSSFFEELDTDYWLLSDLDVSITDIWKTPGILLNMFFI
ncbi:hypothetical protein J5N97_021326 [Dioscorea zingiberensis]|uniref:Uncharacterized protein n=1 Tax=Dioscorea zingiberensis TaxID=325984 RepID=A0A9D5HEL4_9LILI|nr:hypothetical protein J5N97_021326 [Dioscorea zingiberensis]